MKKLEKTPATHRRRLSFQALGGPTSRTQLSFRSAFDIAVRLVKLCAEPSEEIRRQEVPAGYKKYMNCAALKILYTEPVLKHLCTERYMLKFYI